MLYVLHNLCRINNPSDIFVKSFTQVFLNFVMTLDPNMKWDPSNITPYWGLWNETTEMLFNTTEGGDPDIRSVTRQVHYWNDASEYASLFFEGWYWSYCNRYWESVFSTRWRFKLANIFSNAFMPCLNFTGHGLQELWFVEYLKFLEICVVPTLRL